MALVRALRALGSSAGLSSAAQCALPGAAAGLMQLRYMSGSKLFVGGLAWETDEVTLRDAFSSFGEVSEAKVIMDRLTGRSRGFGFVSFSSEEAAQNALAGMDGKFLGGRTIRVDFATQREPGSTRTGSPRGGGRRFGGGNRYNNNQEFGYDNRGAPHGGYDAPYQQSTGYNAGGEASPAGGYGQSFGVPAETTHTEDVESTPGETRPEGTQTTAASAY